ncbi:MAG: hypothetical protein L6422_07475 [Candidatus Marinimicrobia bacterium]|nr:hypothetical protein [Candidatus Neomarinimicrobiota bacterium]
MGISVHYKGRINDPVREGNLRLNIDRLIDEISDICGDMKWEYTVIQKEENDIDHPPIQGIVFSIHEGCEIVGFIFDKKGYLRSPISIPFYEENDNHQLVVSVKTQFSSPDIHIVLIKLLRYIKSKYIENLEVTDEGEFWETSNKERLKYLFDFLNEKLNMIGDILEGNKNNFSESDSPEQIADKVEELLSKYMFNNKKG